MISVQRVTSERKAASQWLRVRMGLAMFHGINLARGEDNVAKHATDMLSQKVTGKLATANGSRVRFRITKNIGQGRGRTWSTVYKFSSHIV